MILAQIHATNPYVDFTNFNCPCTQTQTCPHYPMGQATTQLSSLWAHWYKILEEQDYKRWRRVKPEPVPYYRAKPRKLKFKPMVNTRGMFVRRVKPLNRRNS